MRLQTLVATMRQTDFSKVEEMNIGSDCILANQSDFVAYAEKQYDFGTVKLITTNTRGIGINRNLALMYADADYLLFADDDVKYENNYEEIILKAFEDVPDADGLIFNLNSSIGENKRRRYNSTIERIKWYNAMNYGAVRLAVKRTSILRENITFNRNFGGGTMFSAGEDTMFIADMMKKKLKLYTYPATIATVNDDQSSSTWFKGYNEKYYYDQGIFNKALHPYCAALICIQHLLRHPNYKENGLTFCSAYDLMKKGMKGYERLRPYQENK